MTDLSPETVGKLVAFVRELAPYSKRAEMLAAELPEPADPDLVEAREIVVNTENRPLYSWEIREGKHDDHFLIVAVLAAIKRGRALAAGDRL